MPSSLAEILLIIIFAKWFVTLRIFWTTPGLTLAHFLGKRGADGKTMDTNLPWEFHTDRWKSRPGDRTKIAKWSQVDALNRTLAYKSAFIFLSYLYSSAPSIWRNKAMDSEHVYSLFQLKNYLSGMTVISLICGPEVVDRKTIDLVTETWDKCIMALEFLMNQ